MAGIFKRLSANDIKITPFEAHKTYSNTDLSSLGASSDYIHWSSSNKATFSTQSLKYFQIDKLYYRNYIKERANRLELEDATYTTQERRLHEDAIVLSLPQKTFGSEIQPGTFILSSSIRPAQYFFIRDDGFGNLYDVNKGRENFPNEDQRIFYLGPTQAFKRADLTVDYETGNKFVNNPFPDGYTRTVYDDSYFSNEVEFKNVKFELFSSASGMDKFYGVKTFRSDSYIKVPHQPQFNFEPTDNFAITFQYQINETDLNNLTSSLDYFILTKEGTQRTSFLPSEATRHVSLSDTGSSQISTIPSSPKFPYRIYYKGNYPAANSSSIFFEQSDGETTSVISQSFFTDKTALGESKFVAASVFDRVMSLRVDDEKFGISNTNLTKSTSNKADITLYNKPNFDGTFSNFIGKECGQISQLMIWNGYIEQTNLAKISSSITGTPNIGNIFYDNGFVTITHPSYTEEKGALLQGRSYNVFKPIEITSRYDDIIGNSGHTAVNVSDFHLSPVINGEQFLHTVGVNEKIVRKTLSTPYDLSTVGSDDYVFTNGNSNATNPISITFNPDGTKLFIAVYTNNGSIHEIDLTNPFEIKPQYSDLGNGEEYSDIATHTVRFGFEYPRDMVFNNDGTQLFVLDNENNLIKRFNLNSTPYSLANIDKSGVIADENQSLNIDFNNVTGPGTFASPNGFSISSDGHQLFVLARVGNKLTIHEHKLHTAFDLSTAEYIGVTHRIGGGNTSVYDASVAISMQFSPDGNTLFSIIEDVSSSENDLIAISLDDTPDINKLEYKNTHLITENEYQCTMTEDEFEFTRNLSARKLPFSDSEELANFATGSNFKPYITSIGLYDDDGNLLVTGKLGQPIKASSETDTTFVIRFDT